MTRRSSGALGLAAVCLLAGACRQDLYNQHRMKPLADSDFFADGQGSRPLVAGTVPRGFLREDKAYYTGQVDGKFLTAVPVAITRALLSRGQERFNIYCTPCHGKLGDGHGMIVSRGFKQPQTFHSDRLRVQAVGYFYDVMTQGFGQMSSYASQVPPEDRWAIAAYVRALQYSQHAPASELAAADKKELEKAK